MLVCHLQQARISVDTDKSPTCHILHQKLRNILGSATLGETHAVNSAAPLDVRVKVAHCPLSPMLTGIVYPTLVYISMLGLSA